MEGWSSLFCRQGGFDGCNGGGNDKVTGTDICDDWDGWEGVV